jgi:translocation and assembly module TamB
VGLDEFTIGSGAGLEQSSLLLGKYLTPDLYVRYALGLFDNEGTLQLNYRLTDSLSVEAQSGASQGVDLIYSIEREQLFRRR